MTELGSDGAADLTWWIVDPQIRPNGKQCDVDVLGRMEAASFHVGVATTAAGVNVYCAVPRVQRQELGPLVVGTRSLPLLARI